MDVDDGMRAQGDRSHERPKCGSILMRLRETSALNAWKI